MTEQYDKEVSGKDAWVNAIIGDLANHPLHRSCELTVIEAEAGKATTRFAVNDFTANRAGVLHGGILYALLDVSCFAAVVPGLEAGQMVVSHDAHFSVVRSAPAPAWIEVHARVDKFGRAIVFSRADAYLVDENDRAGALIGMGTVTKSIVPQR